MATHPVTVRVPVEYLEKLKDLAAPADKSLTDVVLEAIAAYLGEDRETVPARLDAIETEVKELRGKLRSLAS